MTFLLTFGERLKVNLSILMLSTSVVATTYVAIALKGLLILVIFISDTREGPVCLFNFFFDTSTNLEDNGDLVFEMYL